MAERKKIGLVYQYNEGWIAGAYYILNIIKALNELPIEQKPNIVLFHKNENGLELIKNLQYPFVQYYNYKPYDAFVFRAINRVWKILFKKFLIQDNRPKKIVDNIYPANWASFKVKNNFFWVPDMQELHYPEFFSAYENIMRKKAALAYSKSKNNIVFSSQNALSDFKNNYPSKTATLKVLPFVSIIDNKYKQLDIDKLKQKFNITKPYFIVSNQFWQHKNHQVVLEAVNLLKNKINNFSVIFTGNENDYRNKQYTSNLKQYIVDNEIAEYCSFLGFIERDEQLQLMNHAISIIQPSLFEGWSTVVEDAKILNKFIILSNIPVHIEQINENVSFFEKNNPADLEQKMLQVIQHTPTIKPINYKENILAFATKIISTLASN